MSNLKRKCTQAGRKSRTEINVSINPYSDSGRAVPKQKYRKKKECNEATFNVKTLGDDEERLIELEEEIRKIK